MSVFGWILLILVGAFFIYELVTLIRDLKNRKKKKVKNNSVGAQTEDKSIRR